MQYYIACYYCVLAQRIEAFLAKFIEEHINEEKVKEAVRTLNKQKVRTHLQTKGPEKKR